MLGCKAQSRMLAIDVTVLAVNNSIGEISGIELHPWLCSFHN